MKQLGCDYQGKDFGAGYIDSCCIDGFLWDLDSGDGDRLSYGGDIPCPECNHKAWIEYIGENIENEGYEAFEEGKSIEDCPYSKGCGGLRYPDDCETYKVLWVKGYNQAKQEDV